jgi:hypothetical protein
LIQAAIAKAVAEGLSFDGACQSAGVSPATGWRWLQLGRKLSELADETATLQTPEEEVDRSGGSRITAKTHRFLEFYEAITYARAEDEGRRLSEITAAATGGQVVYQRTIERKLRDGTVVVTTVTRYASPQWRASAWILERRDPARWGRLRRMDR